MVSRRREEEKFSRGPAKRHKSSVAYRRRKSSRTTVKRKSRLSDIWNRLTEGPLSSVLYIFLGVSLALLTKQALAMGLSTEMPVVSVVSPSMQHDNADITHYQWLYTHLNYSNSYVNSWPVPNGFLIGDMPIVKGEEEYKVGDIIVYSVQGQEFPIIHRIIKINEDGTYQTKGDNNIYQWPYEFRVSNGQIYGKVLFVIPKLGYFKVIIHNLWTAIG
jgi:signal peptidase I